MTIARRYVSSAKGDADVLVISLGDRAGIEAATELHTELEGAAAGGSRRVIVELPRALAVDPTLLGVLLAGLRRLQRAGADLVLVAPDGLRTESAVDALRLDRFFRIERSVSDGVAAFGPHRVGVRTSLAGAHVSMEP